MATVLDIANRKIDTASLPEGEAPLASGIEKSAELKLAPGALVSQTSLVGLTREELAERLGASIACAWPSSGTGSTSAASTIS
jgi:hypothetical protein